jgi:hypothetical protein
MKKPTKSPFEALVSKQDKKDDDPSVGYRGASSQSDKWVKTSMFLRKDQKEKLDLLVYLGETSIKLLLEKALDDFFAKIDLPSFPTIEKNKIKQLLEKTLEAKPS